MSTDLISSTMDPKGYSQYEVAVTRMMSGTVDEVRPRLADALESLGFHVVEEQPLMAQRRVKGWSAAGCSTNIAESPASVHVKLKEAGSGASLATFTYTIKAASLSKGDRRVLSKEVDAVVALARTSAGAGMCARCGTDVPEDSRFCRRCGAPVAAAAPAEVDLYRLAASSEHSYWLTRMGVVMLLATLAFLALGIWLPPQVDPSKAAKLLTVFGLIACAFGVTGLATIIYAQVKLATTLRAVGDDREAERKPAYVPPLSHRPVPQLHARPEPVSVTEGTTSLLDPQPTSAPAEADVRVRHTS
jgi:hypothetical protein